MESRNIKPYSISPEFKEVFGNVKEGTLKHYAIRLLDQGSDEELDVFMEFGGEIAIQVLNSAGKKITKKNPDLMKGKLKEKFSRIEKFDQNSDVRIALVGNIFLSTFGSREVGNQAITDYIQSGRSLGEAIWAASVMIEGNLSSPKGKYESFQKLAVLEHEKENYVSQSKLRGLKRKGARVLGKGGDSEIRVQNRVDEILGYEFSKIFEGEGAFLLENLDSDPDVERELIRFYTRVFTDEPVMNPVPRTRAVQGADQVMRAAAKAGNAELIQLLKENRNFIESFTEKSLTLQPDEQGRRALMIAAENGNLEAFQALYPDDWSKIGDNWFMDNEGKNLLQYALEGGNSKIVDFIKSKNPEMYQRLESGKIIENELPVIDWSLDVDAYLENYQGVAVKTGPYTMSSEFKELFGEVKEGTLDFYALQLLDQGSKEELETFLKHGGEKALRLVRKNGRKIYRKNPELIKGELKEKLAFVERSRQDQEMLFGLPGDIFLNRFISREDENQVISYYIQGGRSLDELTEGASIIVEDGRLSSPQEKYEALRKLSVSKHEKENYIGSKRRAGKEKKSIQRSENRIDKVIGREMAKKYRGMEGTFLLENLDNDQDVEIEMIRFYERVLNDQPEMNILLRTRAVQMAPEVLRAAKRAGDEKLFQFFGENRGALNRLSNSIGS